MSVLGQYLLARRWIDDDQLSEALLTQQEVGGRLGTSLLEKGFLSEQRLLEALSAQQEAPVATADDLKGISPRVIELLPARIASRHLAIPFRALGSKVDVAVARTDNLAQLDELSFVVGKSLRPHLAVEARLYHALETYYRVPCPRRFRLLVERLDRGPIRPAKTGGRRPAHAAARRAPEVPVRVTSGPRRVVRRLEPPEKRSIPLTEDQRRALRSTTESAAGPPPTLAERLAAAGSPEQIGSLVLGALDEHFVRALLFRVARGSVSGWLGHGPGIDRDWLAGYSVGLRQATVFRTIEGGAPFRGLLPAGPAHDSLARCWGGGLQNECLVLPVRVRQRMICAVYGDRGPLGLTGLESGAVEHLAEMAGIAFERLILDRKLRG